MLPRIAIAIALWVVAIGPTFADVRQDACKKAMNDRIQACTDDCTKAALAAASSYVDTNNNVKFGCMKGCAVRQVLQMQACANGGSPSGDPTETNR